jgi:hypothetical protein
MLVEQIHRLRPEPDHASYVNPLGAPFMSLLTRTYTIP